MAEGADRSAIGVVGVGYVGLVTAVCFADLGNHVICVDVSEERIRALRDGRVPIYEPGIERLLERNRDRLEFTLDMAEVFDRAQVVFVCVDTPPTHSGDADLSRVHRVIDGIPQLDERVVLVMKSTVPVGTGERLRADLAARGPAGRRLRLESGVPSRGPRDRRLHGARPDRHRQPGARRRRRRRIPLP